MSDDTISRQAALDIFDDYNVAVENGQIEAYSRDRKRLCDLPPAQPEPCEDAVSRKAAIEQMQGLPKWNGIIADSCVDFDDVISVLEDKEKLPPVTPKQRTGKWILDRSGAYCCSECLEPCAGYVMMKPRQVHPTRTLYNTEGTLYLQ